MLMHFLVGTPAISAQRRRYHRLVTGTILRALGLDWRLEELEATRHALLEDTLRVILHTRLLQPSLPPSSTENMLPRMRIIKVYVVRLHTVCSGSNVNVIDKLRGDRLNCGGILRILPGACELGHNDRSGVGGKSRYGLLQKWRTSDNSRHYGLERHRPDYTRAVSDTVARALPKIVSAMQEGEMEVVCGGDHYLAVRYVSDRWNHVCSWPMENSITRKESSHSWYSVCILIRSVTKYIP